MTGLTANDFEVVEGGKRQTITVFSGGGDERPPDLHLGILFDVSSSFARGGLIQGSRYTAIELLNRLPEAVDYTLVVVDGCVQVSRFTRGEVGKLIQRIREVSEVVYPPSPTAAIGPDQPRAMAVSPEALRRVEAYRKREKKPEICYDDSVIWDGLMAYLSGIDGQIGRHVLVAFTDGEDVKSKTTFGDMRTAIRSSAITMFGVGPVAAQNDRWALRFQQLVDETAGINIFPYGQQQLEEVHRRIVREIRSQYTLGYVSTDERRDGRWREVKIRLPRKEHKDLRIRARDGYYAAKATVP